MSTARLDDVRAAFLADLAQAGGDADAVEKVRVKYAGKKAGALNELTARLRELPNEEKRDYGKALNELKTLIKKGFLIKEIKLNLKIILQGFSNQVQVSK